MPIFELISDKRPLGPRVLSLATAVVVNAVLGAGILIYSEISAVRHSSWLISHAFDEELRHYRVVLMAPTIVKHPAARPDVAARLKRLAPRHKVPAQLSDPRLLDRMEPEVADFVRVNPELKEVVTSEMTRDIDAHVLNIDALLQKSSLEVGLTLDGSGHVTRCRILRSSRVPSIDHLALALSKLPGKYHLLEFIKGLKYVSILIEIDRQVTLTVDGEVDDPRSRETALNQVQNALTLGQFALADTDFVFVLQGVALATTENHIILSKSLEKQQLLSLLMQHSTQQETAPSNSQGSR